MGGPRSPSRADAPWGRFELVNVVTDSTVDGDSTIEASLVDTGEELGISTFLLVQWVAPVASESPELIVACLYAWRLKAGDSLGAGASESSGGWGIWTDRRYGGCLFAASAGSSGTSQRSVPR